MPGPSRTCVPLACLAAPPPAATILPQLLCLTESRLLDRNNRLDESVVDLYDGQNAQEDSEDGVPARSDAGALNMLYPKSVDDDCLPAADLARLIARCDRFEADWNAGAPRRIEDEVAAGDEPIRARLFRELLALEIELKRRDGRVADQDIYLTRFPEHAHDVRMIFGGASPTATATWGETTTLGLVSDQGAGARGYEIIRQLGGGGQAVTYLARNRALQRLVVLKRYHGAASPSRREAVLNEGRALARVRSPFVAPCYGVEIEGEEINLVVEYVPGRPLTELTAAERADSLRCAKLVEQVADGLGEVHACGLLHRDIKPHNIILGDDGVPRLVDFGVAVPVASEALHLVAGSPPYMAPEQARGQGERVDARTDVYGLGAVLYYLLTGVAPHDGDTVKDVIQQAQCTRLSRPARSIDASREHSSASASRRWPPIHRRGINRPTRSVASFDAISGCGRPHRWSPPRPSCSRHSCRSGALAAVGVTVTGQSESC